MHEHLMLGKLIHLAFHEDTTKTIFCPMKVIICMDTLHKIVTFFNWTWFIQSQLQTNAWNLEQCYDSLQSLHMSTKMNFASCIEYSSILIAVARYGLQCILKPATSAFEKSQMFSCQSFSKSSITLNSWN